jgi:membrane-associated phospholipid phosphatase
MMRRLALFDATLSQRFALAPTSAGWRWARLAAHLGDGQLVFGGLGLVYVLGWWGHSPGLCRNDLIIVLAALVTGVAATLVKYAVRRQRPQPAGEFVALQYDFYSFPSGHAARMAVLAVMAAFFYPAFGWLFGGLALTVAAARVAVGVHYPSDVTAGLALGVLVGEMSVVLLPILTYN